MGAKARYPSKRAKSGRSSSQLRRASTFSGALAGRSSCNWPSGTPVPNFPATESKEVIRASAVVGPSRVGGLGREPLEVVFPLSGAEPIRCQRTWSVRGGRRSHSARVWAASSHVMMRAKCWNPRSPGNHALEHPDCFARLLKELPGHAGRRGSEDRGDLTVPDVNAASLEEVIAHSVRESGSGPERPGSTTVLRGVARAIRRGTPRR